jgi:hypothetical protein
MDGPPEGIPDRGACLLIQDPLADKAAFDGKILEILRSRRVTYRVGDVIQALQEAGLGKERTALSRLVPQALRRLKRRGVVLQEAGIVRLLRLISGRYRQAGLV